MIKDLDEQLSRYGAHLDSLLDEVGPEQAIARATSQVSPHQVEGATFPTWRRGLVVAFGAAAAVIVVVGVVAFLARSVGPEEMPPATVETTLVSTTVPVIPTVSALSAGSLNEINEIALAPEGHLWAATSGGVVRWDVTTGDFVVFTEDDGVPGRSVERLEIAPDGTVWITTDSGIGRYDGSWHVYSAENTPELAGQLGALVTDHEGVVWVAVASEPIARFDGSWAPVDPPPEGGWPAVMPDALAVGADGTLWVGTHFDGVFAFDGSTWLHFDESDGAPSRAERVVVAPDESVWTWANGYYTDADLSEYVPGTGFARYDGTDWTVYTVDDGLLSNEGSVVFGSDGIVSVIHAELGPDHEPVPIGTSRFDGATWTTDSDVDGSRGGPSAGAVADPNGTLWMPTESGIVGFDGVNTVELVVPAEQATPPIRPFILTEDPDQTPISVSTVIGDFEFTTLQTPGYDVFDTETTPFGWMTLGENVVRRSSDGLTWDAVLTGAEDLWIMADGDDLILYGWGLVRYSWDGAGWTEVAAAEMPGRMQGLAFGPNGAVALVDNAVYYSTDGVTFAPAEAGPGPVPVNASRPLGCATGWPEISVAGPGGGPILVTEKGYVLLASASEKWDRPGWCEPLVWSSADGNRWELLTPRSPFGESTVVDVATFGGRFVAMGDRDIWVSDDGINWQIADVPHLGSARGIAAGDLGWFLVGGADNADDRGLPTDMWFSADGVNWDGPYAGPEGFGWLYFHIEPSVGSDAIVSVNGGHDGLIIGRLQE